MRTGKDKTTWITSFSNDLGRLTQGTRNSEVTNYVALVNRRKSPKDKKVDCSLVARSIRPQKVEAHRARTTVGVNMLGYEGSTKASMVDVMAMKLLPKNVLNTPGAKFMTAGMKIFYLKHI